jgi:hypothetical protein
VAKALERVVRSVTERFFVITSRVSLSPPSVVSRVVVVSSVSQLVSTLQCPKLMGATNTFFSDL